MNQRVGEVTHECLAPESALRRSLVAATAAGLSGLALPLSAQSRFPSGPINMTVCFPAGGQADFVGRVAAAGLQKKLGQPVIVENIPGAGGSLGLQRFLSAKPDGYSLLAATPMELIQTPMAMKVKYEAEDFQMIGLVASSNLLLLTKPTLEVKTPSDLVALARKLPAGKELTFGSVGRGSAFHLVAEKFSQDVGINMLHVPYKGVAPLLTDLSGGQIDLVFLTVAGPVLGMIKTGKLKAIGFAGQRRHSDLPEVPTLNETGLVKNFSFDLWGGLFASKAVPEPVAKQLSNALQDMLKQPQLKTDIESTGAVLSTPMSLTEAARRYAEDIERYRAIGRSIRLQPE